MRVALVSMPWGAADRPALGISLLKAGLIRRGLPCDIHYLNLTFAAYLGLDTYAWVQSELPHVAFAGDWTFAEALHGHRPAADAIYLEQILGRDWRITQEAQARLLSVRKRVEPFLEYCLAAIDWQAYDLVGFTSTFEQNLASLALARRLKAQYPQLLIAFGGANWEGEMGHELHRLFPFVDIVCSGEADESFPALVEALDKSADDESIRRIPGLILRDSLGSSISTGPASPVTRMDDLPAPDYTEYFVALEASGAGSQVVPTLLFETSRGCWWGAKAHCTFCGLNGSSMNFRSKSADHALAELRTLTTTWPTGFVSVVDNILDMRYFRDFLPSLAAANLGVELFYEVKANLAKWQVELLSHAGVHRVQPGIESLSDRLLSAMRKGTTALRNIQLLKWCRQNDIVVDWNILYGFPGETSEDYVGMSALLPAIRFLGPPGAFGPIRLDRFSPYFNTPQDFGLTDLCPVPAYSHLYPSDPESLARIAYYFDFCYAPGQDPAGAAHAFLLEVQDWIANPDPGALYAVDRPDGRLFLVDHRRDACAPEFILEGAAREAYLFCDQIRSVGGVVSHLREVRPEEGIDQMFAVSMLDQFVANRVMVRQGSLYLSLALTVPVSEPALRQAA